MSLFALACFAHSFFGRVVVHPYTAVHTRDTTFLTTSWDAQFSYSIVGMSCSQVALIVLPLLFAELWSFQHLACLLTCSLSFITYLHKCRGGVIALVSWGGGFPGPVPVLSCSIISSLINCISSSSRSSVCCLISFHRRWPFFCTTLNKKVRRLLGSKHDALVLLAPDDLQGLQEVLPAGFNGSRVLLVAG